MSTVNGEWDALKLREDVEREFRLLGVSIETARKWIAEGVHMPIMVKVLEEAGLQVLPDRLPDDYPVRFVTSREKLWNLPYGFVDENFEQSHDFVNLKLAELMLGPQSPYTIEHARAMADRTILLATWRRYKGVYRFDDTLLDAVLKSETDPDIPAESLDYLPEPVLYCDLPLLPFNDTRIAGFFAQVTTRGGKRWLTVVGQTLNKAPVVALELTSTAIVEALQRGPTWTQLWGIVIPMLLYIASPEPDLQGIARKAATLQTKNKRKAIAAKDIQQWAVGARIGAALRGAGYDATTSDGDGTGVRVRPHIRRGHWHGFWYGPRSGQQQLRTRWLPPIPVNVSDFNDLPAVIRPVDLPENGSTDSDPDEDGKAT